MKQGQHVPVGNDLNRDQDCPRTRLYDPNVKKVVQLSGKTRNRGAATVRRDTLVVLAVEEEVKRWLQTVVAERCTLVTGILPNLAHRSYVSNKY